MPQPRLLPILLLAAMAAAAFNAAPRRLNSTSRQLKVATQAADVQAAVTHSDTIAADTSMVRFVGYDKALRSNKETLFVTNLMTGRDIEHVVFRITYFDSSGRQLHQTRKCLYAPVPPGQTRRLDFPSWDKQHSFYYARSPRPRVPAIPYTVKITPDTLIVSH